MQYIITLVSFLTCTGLFVCGNKNTEMTGNPGSVGTGSTKLRITIGTNIFIATLYENESAVAFKEKLPMTVYMKEMNGNEKYVELPDNLPNKASNPRTIQTGDLMLYGSNSIVLFYKSFRTSYSYTRIARIDNPSGLPAALGPGATTIKFDLE